MNPHDPSHANPGEPSGHEPSHAEPGGGKKEEMPVEQDPEPAGSTSTSGGQAGTRG